MSFTNPPPPPPPQCWKRARIKTLNCAILVFGLLPRVPRLPFESKSSDVIRCMLGSSRSAMLFCFFYVQVIFCLTDFSSDPFDFWSSKSRKTGSARRASSGQAALLEPYALLVSKYAIHRNCFEETISSYEGRFLVFKVCTPLSPPPPQFNPPHPHPTSSLLQLGDLDPPLVQVSHNPTPHHLTPLTPTWCIPKPQLATTEADCLPVVCEQFARR